MEDDGDDLDNLFDEYDSNDPQPQENTNNENTEDATADPEKVPVPKRVVKHPRLKFNPERLCGKRGLPILVDHFKGVKFKGKGHEKEDLNKLLTTLELWTHRLFPSMKFEDCLRQIEHLGKKRPVKTCVQKIRLDFPILASDFVRNDEEEDQPEQPNELEPEPPTKDAFDQLFDDYQGNAQPVLTSTPSSSQTGNVLGTSFGANISEEQKKRMEYNKKLAIERRKARMSAIQSNSLADSSENITNVESTLDSLPTEKRNCNDENFLFDYLQQQFTNTEYSVVNEKKKKENSLSMKLKDSKRDEIMESIDEGDKNQSMFSNARNQGFTEDNNKEELGLDELMDLVDEDNRDVIDHEAVPNVKSSEMSYSHSMEESKIIEAVDKVEIDCNALSNNQMVTPNNNDGELELDELMDLVDNSDRNEINNDVMSEVQNNEVKDKIETEVLASADEDYTDETDCNIKLSNVQNYDSLECDNKVKLVLDETGGIVSDKNNVLL